MTRRLATTGEQEAQHGERGIALVAALWAIALLALIAAALASATNSQVTLTGNLVGKAKAEALADAGIYLAIAELLDPAVAGKWRVDGSPRVLSIAGGQVTVIIEDESGKIDLNRTPDQIIRGLLVGAGLEPDAADALVDRIGDYRDADHLKRLNGAEDADYDPTELPVGAKDGLFERVDELRQVPGMTDRLYARIAPVLTAHSGQRQINIASAPEPVLRALPQFGPEQVDALLDARAAHAGDASAALRISVITVRSAAVAPGGGRFVRLAVVQRSADRRTPYFLLAWEQAEAATESADLKAQK